tara:strand:- start:4732 stop:5382 length:651 start_codon:yes stop_codon:yes gene_type:complete
MPVYQAINTAFVHIPKTAGSSIANALYNKNKELSGVSYESSKHETILDIQLYLGGNTIFMPYYKLSVIRNPWDRLVSWFSYYKKILSSGEIEIDPIQQSCIGDFLSMSFGDWVKNLRPTCNKCNSTSVDCPMIPLVPQTRYITDYGGFILMDDIIRFESLEEGWRECADKIGIQDCKLSHLNKGGRKTYSEYYCNDSKKIVSEIYKNDILNLNYCF